MIEAKDIKEGDWVLCGGTWGKCAYEPTLTNMYRSIGVDGAWSNMADVTAHRKKDGPFYIGDVVHHKNYAATGKVHGFRGFTPNVRLVGNKEGNGYEFDWATRSCELVKPVEAINPVESKEPEFEYQIGDIVDWDEIASRGNGIPPYRVAGFIEDGLSLYSSDEDESDYSYNAGFSDVTFVSRPLKPEELTNDLAIGNLSDEALLAEVKLRGLVGAEVTINDLPTIDECAWYWDGSRWEIGYAAEGDSVRWRKAATLAEILEDIEELAGNRREESRKRVREIWSEK
jgi:hypothetical protein